MGAFVVAYGRPFAVVFSLLRRQTQPSSSCLEPRPCRFLHGRRRLNLRCRPSRQKTLILRSSLVNTDICSSVSAEEVHNDMTSAESNCLIPIVHIESHSLETEGLNLIIGDSYVDTILTTLPVLSEEELQALSANPAHPTGLYALYACCLAGNSMEQLWNFAWPAAIALIHPSLLPVAIMGFFAKLAVIAGGPLMGKLMDHFPRLPAYNCLTIVQVAAQLLAVGMIIYAHTVQPTTLGSALTSPWFVVFVIAMSVERLSGLALGVAMERDWVVMLAGTNRPIALAQANAILSRIDLICEIAGASLFGILLSKHEPVTCLKLVAALMSWSLPVLIFLGWLTNKLSAGALERAKCSQNLCVHSFPVSTLNPENLFTTSLEAIQHGWFEYVQQPVLPASIAYVLLYFNIVLAPGSVMTAFLTQHGLKPSIIGGFSVLCACMGVAATFVSAKIVKQLGILKAGAAGLVFQASVLTMAVAAYWAGSLSQNIPFILILCLIVLSRLGHMSYDVVGSQILQTGIPASKANLIGTMEVSIASLAESIMLGVVIIANDASHFGFLSMLSLASVIGAACLYCRWLKKQTDTQRSLFAVEPDVS